MLSDQQKRDSMKINRMVSEIGQLYRSKKLSALQSRLVSAGSEHGGRWMVLDATGKVYADSYSELTGTQLVLPEVTEILKEGASSGYGIHNLMETDPTQRVVFSSFLSFFHPEGQWVSYSTAALRSDAQTTGVLLFSSSVQEIVSRLITMQNQMIIYFLIVALIALIIAMALFRTIARPVAAITRSIQRMGHGDLSVSAPLQGSSEFRRMAQAFNAMAEKMYLLDKSRNQFVSNASHELKTPLATMKILLESMIYEPNMKGETRNEFLSDVNKEIDRLSLIVSDLLTLVKMDSKTMRLNRSTVNLAQIVTDTAHRLTPVAEKRHQTIKLMLSDSCEMYADSAKLTQVVYNLMDNALKYTQENGTIRIRLVRSSRDAILTISDNGPGIPKADQAHIFDRFYRVDKARGRNSGGTGLGLSIVHQLVLMHGGSISVDSEEGHGAQFIVELPIHQG